MSTLRTVSVSEAVKETGFSRDRIYGLVTTQQVAVIRSGPRGRYRILWDSLCDWMTKHTTPVREDTTPRAVRDANRDLPTIEESALFR